jgi:ubiquinone/menaquinone biosynthesis C-methylase UbiE
MRDSRRDVVRRGYDAIAERYLATRSSGGDVALLSQLVARLSSGDAVLDAGCGAGVPVMRELAGAEMRVVGIDLSSTQLELARSRVPAADLAHADLISLPFRDRSFDALVSFYAVIHVPRAYHRAVFAEFRRVLRPGGIALLCLGARDLPEDDDADSWLGTHMFWSHFDARTNLELLRAESFEVLLDRIVADPMDHGHHLFALVTAD